MRLLLKMVAASEYHNDFICLTSEKLKVYDYLFNYRGQNSENEDRLSDGEKEQKSSVSFSFNTDHKLCMLRDLPLFRK